MKLTLSFDYFCLLESFFEIVLYLNNFFIASTINFYLYFHTKLTMTPNLKFTYSSSNFTIYKNFTHLHISYSLYLTSNLQKFHLKPIKIYH